MFIIFDLKKVFSMSFAISGPIANQFPADLEFFIPKHREEEFSKYPAEVQEKLRKVVQWPRTRDEVVRKILQLQHESQITSTFACANIHCPNGALKLSAAEEAIKYAACSRRAEFYFRVNQCRDMNHLPLVIAKTQLNTNLEIANRTGLEMIVSSWYSERSQTLYRVGQTTFRRALLGVNVQFPELQQPGLPHLSIPFTIEQEYLFFAPVYDPTNSAQIIGVEWWGIDKHKTEVETAIAYSSGERTEPRICMHVADDISQGILTPISSIQEKAADEVLRSFEFYGDERSLCCRVRIGHIGPILPRIFPPHILEYLQKHHKQDSLVMWGERTLTVLQPSQAVNENRYPYLSSIDNPKIKAAEAGVGPRFFDANIFSVVFALGKALVWDQRTDRSVRRFSSISEPEARRRYFYNLFSGLLPMLSPTSQPRQTPDR